MKIQQFRDKARMYFYLSALAFFLFVIVYNLPIETWAISSLQFLITFLGVGCLSKSLVYSNRTGKLLSTKQTGWHTIFAFCLVISLYTLLAVFSSLGMWSILFVYIALLWFIPTFVFESCSLKIFED